MTTYQQRKISQVLHLKRLSLNKMNSFYLSKIKLEKKIILYKNMLRTNDNEIGNGFYLSTNIKSHTFHSGELTQLVDGADLCSIC